MNASGLVINLGLKSVRAIVFDERGIKRAQAAYPVHTYLKDTWIEQDPAEWWEKTVISAREVIRNVPAGSIRFVTVTASAACLVPVDASGNSLRHAIMVSDRRSVAEAARLGLASGFDALTLANSSFVPDPYFMAPKALWIQRHEPEICARTRWLMSPGDYLVFRLTGESVTDPLNAEKFFYDIGRGSYPSSLFTSVGLDPSQLVPVATLGSLVGPLSKNTADHLGIDQKTPVVLSTYDAICAFWGSGVTRAGDVADVSGTVTSVRMLSDRPVHAAERRLFTQPMPGIGTFAVGGSNNLGGGLIEWLKQSFYEGETQPYDVMESEATKSGPAARGILFLPYLLGERCPIWDPNARGVFFGLERQHVRGDFARAVLESTAFGLEHVLATIREHEIQPLRLRVSGGLARLRLVSSIKADVTGLPTEVLEEFETAALGAFLIAAVGAKLFPSLEAAARVVSVREVIIPDKGRHERYREWFGLYRRLYERLRSLFDERHELFERHGLGGEGRLENL